MGRMYTGYMASLDTAQDVLGIARSNWIKNGRVRKAIDRAMREVVAARQIAAAEVNKRNGQQISLD